ncbi:CDP-alcohol phosphatidyltransferase family protein [candidate division KSB1 bacterium]
MEFLPEGIRKWYLNLINPAVNFFIRIEINPNHLTTVGFLIQLFTVYFLANGHLFIAGWLILLAGTCDIVDGKVARARAVGTKFGALYDSTLDRYSEFAMFFGIGYYFIKNEFYFSTIVAFLALGGSLMTSYIRARSEGLGLECKVGSMQRPERIVYIGLASIFSSFPYIDIYPLLIVLWGIAVMSNLTAFQRLKHVYYSTNRGKDLL